MIAMMITGWYSKVDMAAALSHILLLLRHSHFSKQHHVFSRNFLTTTCPRPCCPCRAASCRFPNRYNMLHNAPPRQVPLVSLTEMMRKRLKSDTLGNMIFWASFCVLGQPMCLILYYHDYVLAHMGVQGLAKAAAAGAGAAASAAVGSLAGQGFNGTAAAVQ